VGLPRHVLAAGLCLILIGCGGGTGATTSTTTPPPVTTTAPTTSTTTSTTTTSTTTTLPPTTTTAPAVELHLGPLALEDLATLLGDAPEPPAGYRRYLFPTHAGYGSFAFAADAGWPLWAVGFPGDDVVAAVAAHDPGLADVVAQDIVTANEAQGDARSRVVLVATGSDLLVVTVRAEELFGSITLEELAVDASAQFEAIGVEVSVAVVGPSPIGDVVLLELLFSAGATGFMDDTIEITRFFIDDINGYLWSVGCTMYAKAPAGVRADCVSVADLFIPFGPVVP